MNEQPTPRTGLGRHRRPKPSRTSARNLSLTGATLLAMAGGIAAASPASAAVSDPPSRILPSGLPQTDGGPASSAPTDTKPSFAAPTPDPSKPGPVGGVGGFHDYGGLVSGIKAVVDKYHTIPQNRSAFVKSLRDEISAGLGSTYNVMVFNTDDQPFEEGLAGGPAPGNQPYKTTAEYDGTTYTIWVFKEGTFINKGDGSSLNWAFAGFYDRDGNTITFRKGPNTPDGELPDAQCVTLPFTTAGDKLGIADELTDIVASDREDCVRQIVDRVFSAAGQKYNVVVANQSNDIDTRLDGVQSFLTVKYDDVYYGVWLFEDGIVTNNGVVDQSNWGMSGSFDVSVDGRTATFHKL